LEESKIKELLDQPLIELNILPLSFREYLLFDNEYWKSNQSIDEKFNDYLHFGGLPLIFEHKKSDSIFNNILKGIYSTIIVKDLLSQNKIKNTPLLEEIFFFAILNQGEYISSKKIAEYFKTEGVKTTPTTVLDYLKYFDSSYLLYSSKRYNLKCNVYLRTLEKHYIADLGIRNSILGFEDEKSQGVLENLIYFELLRRDYKVNMVKYNSHKIDFLGTRPDKKIYIQAVKNLNDDKLLNDKIKALEAIKDNYDKFIICFDKTHTNNINGIKVLNIIDFLLKEDKLLV
jgi:predicted AAA+ superfamily ATPase